MSLTGRRVCITRETGNPSASSLFLLFAKKHQIKGMMEKQIEPLMDSIEIL
jgi:hypothetical protein